MRATERGIERLRERVCGRDREREREKRRKMNMAV